MRVVKISDLTVRTGLPYKHGELGQLAQAFDEMAASLERRMLERDQAEIALQESQRVMATLLSNLPGMAYRSHHDTARTMQLVSEGCLALTGYAPGELTESRTFIKTIQGMLEFRPWSVGLLLRERGAYLLSPEQAAAGTKRLRTCWAQRWGERRLHRWERGFAGSLWLSTAFKFQTRFVLRWPKGYNLVDAQGNNRLAWQITPSQHSQDHRYVWDARRRC